MGLKGLWIDSQTVPSRDFKTDLFGKKGDVRGLANGRDEKINIDVEFRSIDRDRPSAAILDRVPLIDFECIEGQTRLSHPSRGPE